LLPWAVVLDRRLIDRHGCLRHQVHGVAVGHERQRILHDLQSSAEDLRAANATIEQERAQLAERVVERTAELTAATEELVQASRFKSDFLATMSHELRTPLNGILGMNELLLTTRLTDRQREFVNASTISGRTQLSLVNDILDISKIEAGKLELEMRPCDLESLIYEIVTMFSVRAKQKGVVLSCRLAPETCLTLLCDDMRLRQILVNLLGNAFKFTSTGSLVIESAYVRREENQITIRLSVIDTGAGIPSDKVGRLFTPFTQTDQSTTRRYVGTAREGVEAAKQAELDGQPFDLVFTDCRLAIGNEFGQLQELVQRSRTTVAEHPRRRSALG